jgi:hypothetical protein
VRRETMTPRDFDELVRKIGLLRELFFDLAAVQGKRSKIRLSRYIKKLRISEIEPLLAEINSSLYKFHLFSRYLHKPLSDQISECLNGSKLYEAISDLAISIGIAKRRTLRDAIFRRFSEPPLFCNKDIQVRSVLDTLIELSSLILSIREYARYDLDDSIVDEYCNTHNIDKEAVLSQIEAAINDIQEADGVSNLVKIYLIGHLDVAKRELGKPFIAWRKIIGALVIGSTLINEVTNIPKVEQNVQTAIQYIIEPSVKQNARSSRRPIPLPLRTRT